MFAVVGNHIAAKSREFDSYDQMYYDEAGVKMLRKNDSSIYKR